MNFSLLTENVLAYSLQVGILVLAGGALPKLFRMRVPRVMLGYWHALLAVCLLLPVLQPWKQVAGASPGTLFSGAVRSEGAGSAAGNAGSGPARGTPVLGFLAAGAAVRFIWLGAGLLRLSRYRRKARALDPLPAAVAEMQSHTGARAPVYVSSEIDVPATFGVCRPVILFPARFVKMEASLQQAIACHEFLHVRRFDWVFALVEEIIGALLWFHPAIWWLLGRIHLTREQAVDLQVLEMTRARQPYLKALLQFAAGNGRPEISLAPSLLTRHHLTQRVAMILTEVSMSRNRICAYLVIICALLLAAGRMAVAWFPLAAPARSERNTQQKAQPAPEKPQQEPVRVDLQMQPPKLIHRVDAVYPKEAKDKGLQTRVVLEIAVNEKGQVWNPKVTEGHPLFNDAALEAVRKWRFTPATKDGVAVPVVATVEIVFSLDPKPAETPVIEPIRVGSNVQASKILFKVDPEYPQEAKDQRVQGNVILQVTISKEGDVTDAKVLRGDDRLNAAARNAVVQRKYAPTTLNGKPVPVIATVTISFRLQ